MHLKEEKTFVMIKPDGVKRGLVGEIIKRLEQRGLKLIACALIAATPRQIDRHYPKDKKWLARIGEKTMGNYLKYNIDPKTVFGTDDLLAIGKTVRGWIVEYLTSGPMVKMIVQGVHAIDMVRKLCGNSLPSNAELGSIRGDFSIDSPALANMEKRGIHNLVHASETPEEAAHEMKLWFTAGEIHAYKRAEEDIMF